MKTTRRGFLGILGLSIAAPAIARLPTEKLTWARHKEKLGDPIKFVSEDIELQETLLESAKARNAGWKSWHTARAPQHSIGYSGERTYKSGWKK